MNIEEYISSGILEAYVMGEVSGEELRQLEKNLLLYPELREELNRIEETNENILMASGIQPRTALKQELFAALDKKKVTNPSSPKVITINFWRFATAASFLLALVSSYLCYTYWSKWKTTQADLQALATQNQRMAEDYNVTSNKLGKLERELKVVSGAGFSKVALNGTANAPQSAAYVYWNKATHEVYLGVQQLKDLPQDKQYQLWAIVDGQPVDAGVFNNNTGLLKMKDIENAAAFAVTIEPAGGKPSPTLETMQVIGNVGKT